MENLIEVRHYLNRAGKDVFDDWLSHLADARTQAKIASRFGKVCASCVSIGDLATGSITRCSAAGACCFFAAATNESSRQI